MPLSAQEARDKLAPLKTPPVKWNELRASIEKITQQKFNVYSQPRDWAVVGDAIRSAGFLQRGSVMKKIGGPLRPVLEAGLKSEMVLPYQYGLSRLPFRAPQDPRTPLRLAGRVATACICLRSEHDMPIEWWAEHVAYIHEESFSLYDADLLFAIAIDSGNSSVLDTLIQSLNGSHSVGAPSKVGIRALLRCNDRRAWAEVERVLLNAQRSEGLRQAIMECVDELNLDAFQKFVRLAIEHNLVRFSSVIRAFAVWFPGIVQEAQPTSAVKVLGRVLEFIADPGLQPGPDFQDGYLRLWAEGLQNVRYAVSRAMLMMNSPDSEVRRAAATLGCSLFHVDERPLIHAVLRDQDRAINALGVQHAEQLDKSNPFASHFHDDLRDLAVNWPKEKLPGIQVDRKEVWTVALQCAPQDSFTGYCGQLHELNSAGRRIIARNLGNLKDPVLIRTTALGLASDTQSDVRELAFAVLAKMALTQAEAQELERLLTRKAADLRKSVLLALASQKDADALRSAERLAQSGDALQVQAGEELMRVLQKRGVNGTALSAPDPGGLAADLGEAYLFGLVDMSKLRWSDKPEAVKNWKLVTPESVRMIQELDAWVHERREQSVAITDYEGTSEIPFGALGAYQIDRGFSYGMALPQDQTEATHPQLQELDQWYRARWMSEYPDHAHLLRAQTLALAANWRDNALSQEAIAKFGKHLRTIPRYPSTILGLLNWLDRRHKPALELLLDHLQQHIHETADGEYFNESKFYLSNEKSWRTHTVVQHLMKRIEARFRAEDCSVSVQDTARTFWLYRFIDEPWGRKGRGEVESVTVPKSKQQQVVIFGEDKRPASSVKIPNRIPLPIFLVSRALEHGIANEAEAYDQMRFNIHVSTGFVAQWSPKYRSLVQTLVDRVVTLEVARGDLPSAASSCVSEVRGLIHLNHVLSILSTGTPLIRTADYSGSPSKPQSLTHLLSFSRPAHGESLEDCVEGLKSLKVKPERLVELAMLAPHWARAAERVLEWQGFEEAVWWLHAHCKDKAWGMPKELKELWQGEISERTALTEDQLENGACDPQWFWRFRPLLDEKQWKLLDKCAKFASHAAGHVRSQVYANALTGKLAVDETVRFIRDKRNLNHVRALGLIPLGQDPSREREIRERYLILQEFLAGSREFGAQRQLSERTAAEIGLDNLAAGAGYEDSLRLTWALEASEVEDLRGDGLTQQVEGYKVRLFFDELGQPTLNAEKEGKVLREIPAALKKMPEVKELSARRALLKKQMVRMRLALELAMQRSDSFTPEELQSLMQHPGLMPLLRNLVFLSESGAAGFPDDPGRLLGEPGSLRIAHPYDLLKRGDWPEWQRRLFLEERIQPFKQVFRELYVLTDPERDQTEVTRYAGHQVRPAQTLAILGKRGWVARFEEGMSKTFHRLGISARLLCDFVGYSPADIEGAPLKSLIFTKSREWKALPLSEIPPIVFSETLRDLDLVVSVAHATGYDPEASESTLAMRQRLVEQTSNLLKLENVQIAPKHVKITGKLGEYTVHLGSGLVHQLAKGELVIVAVRQPQRGRLFLPFVDEDPRSAEIVSKVILMARDDEIKDPGILNQIIGV